MFAITLFVLIFKNGLKQSKEFWLWNEIIRME